MKPFSPLIMRLVSFTCTSPATAHCSTGAFHLFEYRNSPHALSHAEECKTH